MSGGHGHIDSGNKRVALLIAVLALCLALAETLAKGAQTDALSYNVEASNLWAFFQAKTIRQTMLRGLSETVQLDQAKASPDTEAVGKRLAEWRQTIDRWESEPKAGPKGEELGEGRKELSSRAVEFQKRRDLAMAKYHHYEVGSAAFQIAIVLASATVITGAAILTWLAGGLGLIGIGFTIIGLVAPHAFHLF